MRVAMDARKIEDFGIGSYLQGLLGAMTVARPGWTFVLLAGLEADRSAVAGANVVWTTETSRRYGVGEILRLGRRARVVGADVFHSPHYTFPFGLACPGVVTIHDCIHLRFPGQLPRPLGVLPRSLARAYALAMMRHAVRAAARVITVSESTAADLRRLLGAPAARISVVPNGCDPSYRRPPTAQEHAAAAAVGLPSRFVLFVGNAKPHKNLRGLLAALALLADGEDPVHLVVAGTDAAALPPLPAQLPPGRVRALGRVPAATLRGLHAHALAVCVPSLHEGFGLPALEAMAAGTPVICSPAGGLAEVAGEATVTIDPADPEAIARAIEAVTGDPELRARLRAAGRRRAQGFTWERAAEATLEVYEQVVEGARR